MSGPLTLDLIEARAKALGWRTGRETTDPDSHLLHIWTPSGYVVYGVDDDGAVSIHDRETDLSPCRHDLAALESPDPARPVVDPVTGLLPCPFCGGRAETGPFCSASLECGGCGLRVYGHSRPEVRAAWNRRTP